GALTDSQWVRLLRLCIEGGKGGDVAGLLSDLGALGLEHGDFGTVIMPVLRSKFPEAVDWISRAAESNKDADTVISIANVDSVPAAQPPVRAQCLSLYRGLLRVIGDFPLTEMRGKLKHNARFCFELYRDLEEGNPKIQQLVSDGQRQLQWLGAK
ncbi:hypothetical protein FBU31_004410, partial [Coemansia sp. 'formosensis']